MAGDEEKKKVEEKEGAKEAIDAMLDAMKKYHEMHKFREIGNRIENIKNKILRIGQTIGLLDNVKNRFKDITSVEKFAINDAIYYLDEKARNLFDELEKLLEEKIRKKFEEKKD